MAEANPFDFVRRLAAEEVHLVVIGGHAVNYHGYPRSTQDIDLIFSRTPASEVAVANVLSEFEAFWISDEIDPATGIEKTVPVTLSYVRSHRLMMLGSHAGFIDIFDFIPGLPNHPLDDLLATASVAQGIPFASLPWLRRIKQASGRPRDQLDLDNLPR